MQVSVETTDGLERRMTVELPVERIDGEVQNRLQRASRNVRIKGFRPGKVPLKVVAQQYGKQIRDEVVGELIQASYFEAVGQQSLRPAGVPAIEPVVNEPGKALQYTATFEVMPEVTLADVAGVKLEKRVAEISEADLDKMMETLRKQRAAWEKVERAAAEGDRLNIDFKGTIDGEAFAGNSGEAVPVTLGSNRMIEGFEAGLVGAKAGDELTLNLQFPEEYAHKEVAGKPVQFTVKVNSVEESRLPELDEEFAKSFGIGDGSLDALRQEVRQNMEREMRQALTEGNKQVVMNKLLELNPITVPQALVREEAEALRQQMQQQLYRPQDKSGIELDVEMFREQAQRRIALGLILSELIRSKELKADTEKVRARVEELASTYDEPQQVIDWYYGDKGRLSQVESLVLEDAVVDWVYSQVEVTEKSGSFDEVMGRG
ncbi:MAG: trigger factor [Gammaproteobacteria bacterium]|nr:trigger factor [Gammaproteobacteria bacterium]